MSLPLGRREGLGVLPRFLNPTKRPTTTMTAKKMKFHCGYEEEKANILISL
jgi:hypothetical protein